MPSAAAVARRALDYRASALSGIEDELARLQLLDDALTRIEQDVAFNFRMAALDPEVNSQFDALKKAREGIQVAEASLRSLQQLLVLHPTDRKIQRMVADLEGPRGLIVKFRKHEKAATAIIRRLSKKAFPPELLKAAKQLTPALKRLMTDASQMEVIPWQRDSIAHSRHGPTGIEYQLIHRVHPTVGTRTWKVDITLLQATNRRDGVMMMAPASVRTQPYNLKEAKVLFLQATEGWDVIRGQAEANAGRASAKAAIIPIFRRWLDHKNDRYSGRVTIEDEGTSITGLFHWGQRWEQESEWDYDEGTNRDSRTLNDSLKKALDRHMGSIKNIDMYYNEKSLWSAVIRLK